MTASAAGTFTETVVEAADARIQLRMGGSGEPLLVLHGELGVPGWLRTYQLLAEHFTVYVPSLPGFGQSSRPDWIASIRDLAAWVTWGIRDLKLPQPLNVMGCSMGGWVAAEIATMNTTLFKKMVLVGPAGLKPETGEIWDYFVHSARDAMQQSFYAPEQCPEYRQYYGNAWTPEDEAQAESHREMASRLFWKPYMRSRSLPALLRSIATPTLLVWGRQDAIIPVNAYQLYQQGIPGAVTKILEQCGHLAEMEQPQALVQAVLDFLAPHPTP